MTKEQKLSQFFAQEGPYQTALEQLRNLILRTDLVETYKWQFPVYTLDGKNVVGLGAFKHHFGIWFFQGALLQDEAKKLINAQEGKTAAMRQWRFSAESEIDEPLLTKYVEEAIENERQGRRIKATKPIKKAPALPQELKDQFDAAPALEQAFAKFTPGKQKTFIEYVEEAKRPSTKATRIEKIKPLIYAGRGLHDKYK